MAGSDPLRLELVEEEGSSQKNQGSLIKFIQLTGNLKIASRGRRAFMREVTLRDGNLCGVL